MENIFVPVHRCFKGSKKGSMVTAMFPIIITIIILSVIIRGVYVLFQTGKPLGASRQKHFSTLIILGSGGHTAEMLNLVRVLHKERFWPRYYISAATDNMSLQKAKVLEESDYESSARKVIQDAQFMKIYRSREVGQSYLTSVGTTLIAMFHAFWLISKIRPEVILCNGPGTCIPLCLASFLLKVFGIKWSSIIYVESIARVRKLSLSGLILYKLCIADQFFVQWPQLRSGYPGAHYVGCLM